MKEDNAGTLISIPLDDIYIDEEFNSRGQFNKTEIADLMRSIKEQGLIQPITVRKFSDEQKAKFENKTYGLVAGFRRFFAHKALDWDAISAINKGFMTDKDAQVINLSENMKRKDLNILQEAIAVSKIPGTLSEIAKQLGISTGWVQVRQNLLKLEPEIQKEAAAGMLTQHHIQKLVGIKNPEQRFEAVRKIKDHRLKDSRAADIVIKKDKQFADTKKVRQRPEIFEMQNLLREKAGNGIWTRLLGWCAGEVSNHDMHDAIKDFLAEKGVEYEIPNFDVRLSEVA